MSDEDFSLHRVRGLASGANWRLTKFVAPVPHLTCGLCKVISCPTFLLPCLHTLCESCVIHSVNDGNTLCPFDEEPFTVGDCEKFQCSPGTSDKLKACCWNEAHGCTFVGTLQAVLTHYEQECAFHTVICPRCNGSVLHQDLPGHYRAGCHIETIAPGARDPSLQPNVAVSAEELRRCIEELKALIRDPFQDRLPELQSKINDVFDVAWSMGPQIDAITRFGKASERKTTQAFEQLPSTFAQELQSQLSVVCTNLKENFRTDQILGQVMNHGKRIDAVARQLNDRVGRLSHQLEEATKELLTTFSQKFQAQQREFSTLMGAIIEVGTRNSGEAATSSTNQISWRFEKRHILRKLEQMATESHAHLEVLRASADQQLKRPVVEYRPVLPGVFASTEVIPPLTGKRGSEQEVYVVSLKDIDDVGRSGNIIGLFTAWYRRDKYVQVAAYGVGSILMVCLKWGATLQFSCSPHPEATICVRHPDYPEKEGVYIGKNSRVGPRAQLFAFQENFEVSLLEIEQLGLARSGKLTLVVSFKV